jgi:hypothetical protein
MEDLVTATNGPIAARPWPRLVWAAAVTACLLAVAWALQWVPLPGRAGLRAGRTCRWQRQGPLPLPPARARDAGTCRTSPGSAGSGPPGSSDA